MGRQTKTAKSAFPAWTAVIAVVIVAVAAVAAFAVSQPQGSASQALPPTINVAEASAKRNAGAYILDVREPSEWVDYHVPGSTQIPLGSLASRVNEVPKDKEVVVVCHSGNRSQTGRDILLKAGFTRVTSMSGGLVAWGNQGLPLVNGQ
jgi:rhodanese-related sulfurtransferase